MPGASTLSALPGIRESACWPWAVQPATWQRRPAEPGQPYLFALCLPDAPEAWIEWLMPRCSSDRAARAARFRRAQDALSCLAAEALFHHAAKEVLELSPEELGTARGAQGKPACASHPEVHFNLSHSGGWILCALHDAPVGVDVEATATGRADPPTFMSPQEILRHTRMERDDQSNHCFRLWTLKESLLKAAGTGLSHDPRLVTISPGTQGIHVVGAPSAPPGRKWRLETLPMPEGAAAALCYAGPDPPVSAFARD